MELQTKRILLRDIADTDHKDLFEWRNNTSYRTLVNPQNSIITFQKYLTEFNFYKKARKYQLVIVSKEKSVNIGMIYTHTFSTENGYCFINLYIHEPYTKFGYGIEAFGLLSQFLFEDTTFYKIYVEVFSYNLFSLKNIRNLNFEREGVFIGHKVLNGIRYDVIRYAVYRKDMIRLNNVIEHFRR